MEKTTTKPWHIEEGRNINGVPIKDTSGNTIAVVQYENDAPLVTAAPELLEALEVAKMEMLVIAARVYGTGDLDYVHSQLIRTYSAYATICAAIAKARGEG